jgi:hypothetical protein
MDLQVNLPSGQSRSDVPKTESDPLETLKSNWKGHSPCVLGVEEGGSGFSFGTQEGEESGLGTQQCISSQFQSLGRS